MKKTNYKGFKIGQNVILNNSLICDNLHFSAGHEFKIISFPRCATYIKKYEYFVYEYFVYGKDDNNNHIRCNINEIKN